ncbi:MAG: RNA 2',3'-cyclic phosphodiesterase [Acidobacteria bacterium]|jgi:2'-5' RNA ligase|nr:RNA 2',3'-cyclic phosphodiesterase [Acidobacteriota bacterium]
MRGGEPTPGEQAERIRAFLAFEMPRQVHEVLTGELRELRPALPRARWVRPEGIHLTVKFLGESPPDDLEELVAELVGRLDAAPTVRVSLGGSGFFPSPRRPRVAWVGGRAEGAERVVAVVEEAASGRGWEAERRSWSPHLTVARLRDPWPPSAVEQFLDWGGKLAFEPFVCSELVLFSSRLQPGGAVYTPLRRLQLAGGGQRDD